jgi:hypothetical protein
LCVPMVKSGKLHREEGPAVELADGSKEFWINGEFIRREVRKK